MYTDEVLFTGIQSVMLQIFLSQNLTVSQKL